MEQSRKLEAHGLRTIAFCGVVLATVAAMCCVIAVPMLYNHMQRLHTGMTVEVDFCRLRATNIWREVTRTQLMVHVAPSVRRAVRGAGYDEGPALNADVGRSPAPRPSARDLWPETAPRPRQRAGCCGCGVSARGLPGPPGVEGPPGEEGTPGQPGLAGEDAPQPVRTPIQPCFDCPQGPQGHEGRPGAKGVPGGAGPPGPPGPPVELGEPGEPGPPGPTGPEGHPGRKGRTGKPGIQRPGDVHVGPEGPPGPPGRVGARGDAGEPGTPGQEGKEGDQGRPGKDGMSGSPGLPGGTGGPGEKGPQGGCDHCPTPRTQPGY